MGEIMLNVLYCSAVLSDFFEQLSLKVSLPTYEKNTY
jgi:hypothetical protein